MRTAQQQEKVDLRYRRLYNYYFFYNYRTEATEKIYFVTGFQYFSAVYKTTHK